MSKQSLLLLSVRTQTIQPVQIKPLTKSTGRLGREAGQRTDTAQGRSQVRHLVDVGVVASGSETVGAEEGEGGDEVQLRVLWGVVCNEKGHVTVG